MGKARAALPARSPPPGPSAGHDRTGGWGGIVRRREIFLLLLRGIDPRAGGAITALRVSRGLLRKALTRKNFRR